MDFWTVNVSQFDVTARLQKHWKTQKKEMWLISCQDWQNLFKTAYKWIYTVYHANIPAERDFQFDKKHSYFEILYICWKVYTVAAI